MIFLKTSRTVYIFYYIQNHPTFHSEEGLVNLVRERECFVSLSILFYGHPIYLPHVLCANKVKLSQNGPLSRTTLSRADRCLRQR